MAHPLFSVVIPTLNEELFLPRLLDSLVNQSTKNFEVIVVDGSSRDATVLRAKEYEKKLPALSILVSKKASLPLQRNLGARQARGKWFVFVDADSVLLPYFTQRIATFINQSRPALFTTWFRPDSEVPSDAVFTLIGNLFIEGSILLKRPLAPGPLTIVNKETFGLVGGYNEALTFGEDYDFTTRVVQKGIPLHILRETLFVVSLRRVRREGKLRLIQLYAKASLLVLLTKKNLRNVPGYIMGGHLYVSTKHKKSKKSILKDYELRLKKLIKTIVKEFV